MTKEEITSNAKWLAGWAFLIAVVLICIGIGSHFLGFPGALIGLGIGIFADIKLAEKYGDRFANEEEKPTE